MTPHVEVAKPSGSECFYDLPTHLYGCVRLHRREPDGCAHLHAKRRHAYRQTLSAASHTRQTALLYPLRSFLLTHALRAAGGQALFQTAKEHQALSHALPLYAVVRQLYLPHAHGDNMARHTAGKRANRPHQWRYARLECRQPAVRHSGREQPTGPHPPLPPCLRH